MEVDQGPNWGGSAKGKKKKFQTTDSDKSNIRIMNQLQTQIIREVTNVLG
jgi:hypothetical protein